MDREERDKLDRLGADALRAQADGLMPESKIVLLAGAVPLARAVLDAVLPAYDAMRDDEWEDVGYVMNDGALCHGYSRSFAEEHGGVAGPVIRRVGKEGGS